MLSNGCDRCRSAATSLCRQHLVDLIRNEVRLALCQLINQSEAQDRSDRKVRDAANGATAEEEDLHLDPDSLGLGPLDAGCGRD